MNILIVGRFYLEGFANHISETFELMGHNPINFEIGIKRKPEAKNLVKRYIQIKDLMYSNARSLPVIKKRLSSKIYKTAKAHQIDLILVCHDFLLPEEVSILKQITNVPIVMWNPDHFATVGKLMFLNAKYDFLFFEDPYIVYKFRTEFNKHAYYLPECFNPIYHRLPEISDYDHETYSCDVTTAGNIHPSRTEVFGQLQNYDVKLWGHAPPLWMDTSEIRTMLMGKPVHNIEKSKAFYYAKVVLNTIHPANVLGLNCRAFEIAGIGGFQMISWRLGLEQLFKDGEEIVSFENYAELKEKLDYYLNNENSRKEIANAGHERALKDHSYEKRLSQLLDTIFNCAEGFPLPDISFKNYQNY